MKKRLISTALFLALLLSAVSCGGTTAPTDGTSGETETSAPEDTSPKYADDLPSDLRFDGKTVTFLYREEVSNEFFADQADGDVVNDAIFDSFRNVEERLGVDINVVKRPGHYTDVRQEYMNHITSTILAGDSEYDFVDLMIGNSPILMQQGIFHDLAQNKYIDLDKPYYLGGLMDQGAIDGKLFFVSGDASLGYMKCAFAMYFNQRLVEDFGIGNPYDIVDAGKWTLDKVAEIASAASQDIDGNSKYDIEDKLGFVVHDWNHPKGFWASTESVMYSRDSSGEWKFTYGSEHDIDVVNKLYNLMYANEGSWFPGITNAVPEYQELYGKISAKFASGEIFIMTAEIDDSVSQLRDMKDDYGILPYPKADENQKEYVSSARNTHNAFSMPITCEDPEMAGAVLEALSSSNHDTVLPAYFETALKKKYARDDDSARMYDIIRDSMKLDFGYLFGNAIGNPESIFVDSYKKENSLASNVAKNQKRLDQALAKYLENLRSTFTE